jgi:hypothetical protein
MAVDLLRPEGASMQNGIDSKIQARVRLLLARRWVDLRAVTVGTTNGVVYIGGSLQAAAGPGAGLPGGEADRSDSWLGRIRREISEIPEVRDVVFQLQNAGATGELWQEKQA